jgi:hypothetical protein
MVQSTNELVDILLSPQAVGHFYTREAILSAEIIEAERRRNLAEEAARRERQVQIEAARRPAREGGCSIM